MLARNSKRGKTKSGGQKSSIAPSTVARAGSESKDSVTEQTDFVEVEIRVSCSSNFQTCAARVAYRTTDPKMIPSHGSSPDEIVAQIDAVYQIVVDTITPRVGELVDTTVDLGKEMEKYNRK